MDFFADIKNEKKGRKKEKDTNFDKEVRMLMFGFGDKTPHCYESVQMINTIVKDYIRDMTAAAATLHNNEKVTTADFLYLVRNDYRKHTRATQLLKTNEDFKRARKDFDFECVLDMD